MGFSKEYFQREPGDPAPLSAITGRRVRFEEVDALGIVWHGRYPSYLEDARAEFGRKYGLSYAMFRKERVAAPIVQMQIDYRLPLQFDDLFTIEAVLYWCDALKLNFEYLLKKESEAGSELVATACTVQLITDSHGRLLLTESGFVKEFRQQWRAGGLHV